MSTEDPSLTQLSTLQCRIIDAYKDAKTNIPHLKVEMRNTAPFDVWVAPAHHITDLYYEEGEGQILRLGLRCRLSRQATAGAQLIRSNQLIDFTVEATPFGDMPEGDYVITLVLSPASSAYLPRYSPSTLPPSTPPAPVVLASPPFQLHWRESQCTHQAHPTLPAVARCIADDSLSAYFSPRTSRPRPRAKSRPSLSNLGSLPALLPATRAAGSRDDGGGAERAEGEGEAEGEAEGEGKPIGDPSYVAPADISPLARFATGRRYSLA